ATAVVAFILANPTIFVNPNPATSLIVTAIKDLELAWNNAQDGGKTKKAVMHDKEDKLMKLMNNLANYVEVLANGDESVVHLAGMDIKHKPVIVKPEFEVVQLAESGSVKVKVKARAKSMYKYQYTTDPDGKSWIDAKITSVTKAVISGLQAGVKYFFRVVFMDKEGEHPNTPSALYVN
ncbi:MAG: fibronectin type III domain-containing protein, partial [Bacteroidia bacterium]